MIARVAGLIMAVGITLFVNAVRVTEQFDGVWQPEVGSKMRIGIVWLSNSEKSPVRIFNVGTVKNCASLPSKIPEERIGRAASVTVEVPGRAMIIVAATLDGDVDSRVGRVALLRVENVGLDLELLHGLGRRREADTAIECVVWRAVERDVIGPCAAVSTEGRQVAVRG